MTYEEIIEKIKKIKTECPYLIVDQRYDDYLAEHGYFALLDKANQMQQEARNEVF